MTSTRSIVVSFSFVVVIAVCVAIRLIGNGNDAHSDDATLTATACREFNETVADTRSGVTTDAEVARRMQKVYDQGRRAGSDLARATFDQFQRARLSGEQVALYEAVTNMSALCRTKW